MTTVLTLVSPSLPERVRLPVRDGETLDAALTRAGFARSKRGCRRGGCGQCKVVLRAGSVRDERPIAPSVLSPAQRAAGEILFCRSVPQTDVEVLAADVVVRLVAPQLRLLAQRELERSSLTTNQP